MGRMDKMDGFVRKKKEKTKKMTKEEKYPHENNQTSWRELQKKREIETLISPNEALLNQTLNDDSIILYMRDCK